NKDDQIIQNSDESNLDQLIQTEKAAIKEKIKKDVFLQFTEQKKGERPPSSFGRRGSLDESFETLKLPPALIQRLVGVKNKSEFHSKFQSEPELREMQSTLQKKMDPAKTKGDTRIATVRKKTDVTTFAETEQAMKIAKEQIMVD